MPLDTDITARYIVAMPDQSRNRTDLTTMSDARLMQYMAFCDEQAHSYSTVTQAGRTSYRREVARITRYMDRRSPVAV